MSVGNSYYKISDKELGYCRVEFNHNSDGDNDGGIYRLHTYDSGFNFNQSKKIETQGNFIKGNSDRRIRLTAIKVDKSNNTTSSLSNGSNDNKCQLWTKESKTCLEKTGAEKNRVDCSNYHTFYRNDFDNGTDDYNKKYNMNSKNWMRFEIDSTR